MNANLHSIRYPLSIDRGLGMLREEPNYDRHVEQLIRQVLLTNPGERINRPDFGCGLRQMVFAPNSDTSASLTQVLVRQSLDKWLGTIITVEEVRVRAIDSTLEITLVYILIARQERRYLNVDVTP